MKKIILTTVVSIGLFCGLSHLAVAAPAPASTPTRVTTATPATANAQVNTELAQLLSAYNSYQANFKQTTYNRNGRLTQKTVGNVKILRPGRFRWETTRPSKQLIIANGDTLWIYDVDLAQATQQKLRQQGLSPAALLSSSATDLAQQFIVRPLGKGSYELRPRRATNNFTKVILRFNNGKLVGLQMNNALGQRSIFSFSNVVINQNLDPRWFDFNPPRGVNVLKS